jgi:hypothetical protein
MIIRAAKKVNIHKRFWLSTLVLFSTCEANKHPSGRIATRRAPRRGFLFSPGSRQSALPAPSTYMPSIETAARSLKVELIMAPVHSDVEIETAIKDLGREPRGGIVIMPDAFTTAHRAPIIVAAARNNVPAVYPASELVRDGGLLSYGPDLVDPFRRAATYALREAQFRFHPRHRAGRPCQAGIFASSSGSRKA